MKFMPNPYIENYNLTKMIVVFQILTNVTYRLSTYSTIGLHHIVCLNSAHVIIMKAIN